MTAHYQDATVTIHHGDCLDVLADLPDASVDAVVTDPPYGLSNTDPQHVADTIVRWVNGDREYVPEGAGFMGRPWDAFVPPVAVWDECLRVLKPGGHVLAFAGTRTVDLMTLGLRLAGFDIRDSIAWMYGSGFPKSLDVSKAIDKAAPRAGMFDAFASHYAERRQAKGLTHRDICAAGRFYGEHNKGGASVNWEKGYNVPTPAQWPIVADLLDIPRDMWADLIARAEAERQVTGIHSAGLATGASGVGGAGEGKDRRDIAATEDAARWQGWGTALKPAHEPIVVARKPLTGTVAANVLAHGTGALNIDACRIEGGSRPLIISKSEDSTGILGNGLNGSSHGGSTTAGRWPANVALDEHQAAELDQQSGIQRDGVAGARTGEVNGYDGGWGAQPDHKTGYGSEGGASRFVYVAKADASERVRVDGTAHPTVKPLALMRWLVRLVTPPGGTVLEPFAGSGTTVEACILEGFHCVAIERETDYLPLIQQRIHRRRDPVQAVRGAGEDGGLFDLLDQEETA